MTIHEPEAFLTACDHLRGVDPVLAPLLPERFPPHRDRRASGFEALVYAVISQQLSVKAAASILGRLKAATANGAMTPRDIEALDDEQLRGAGLSAAKVRTIRGLAATITAGTLDLDAVAAGDDEAVIASLSALPGIGAWTAQMYLIFHLGRPDVMPAADLAIREALRRTYALEARPDEAAIQSLSQPWRPFRTVAALALWESLRAVPLD